MTAAGYRLTLADEVVMRRRIMELVAGHAMVVVPSLRRAAAGAIGCTLADLRDVEVDWIDRQIAAALEPARCPVCAVPLSEPPTSDDCPRPEDHAPGPPARALEDLLDMVAGWTPHLLPSFTCEEAETVAALVRERRGGYEAARFLYAHSCGDDDPDDLHRGMEPPERGVPL